MLKLSEGLRKRGHKGNMHPSSHHFRLVPSRSCPTQATSSHWYRTLAQYERPNLRKATFQLLNTFVPYVTLWILMVGMVRLGVSYWFTLALAVVAAGLLVRIFIFFHDCSHASFFASRRANRMVGYVCGILTFTPYEE